MSDVIKDFNTEVLIEYLKKKNLKLEGPHFEILRKEEIFDKHLRIKILNNVQIGRAHVWTPVT